MKKVCVLLLWSLCFVASAENKVGEYYSGYFGSKYAIEATEVKNGEFSYYIFCKSKDDNRIGIVIESKDISRFLQSVEKLKSKYAEWRKVASENNVTDYTKEFDIKLKPVDIFFSSGRTWHRTPGVRLKPYFQVTKQEECLLVFDCSEVTANDNGFISADGFSMIFSSVREIEYFVRNLDPDRVTRAKKEKVAIDKLFR